MKLVVILFLDDNLIILCSVCAIKCCKWRLLNVSSFGHYLVYLALHLRNLLWYILVLNLSLTFLYQWLTVLIEHFYLRPEVNFQIAVKTCSVHMNI